MIRSVFICLWLFTGAVYATECWSEQELTRYSEAEVDEMVVFSIKDAVSCAPVVFAEVTLGDMTLHTDEYGELKIPILSIVNLKKIRLNIKKPKYVSIEREMEIYLGTIKESRFLLTPE